MFQILRWIGIKIKYEYSQSRCNIYNRSYAMQNEVDYTLNNRQKVEGEHKEIQVLVNVKR